MIKEREITDFIKENKEFGVTTTEVRRHFGIRYDKALKLLKKLEEKGVLERYELGYQTFWKISHI